MEDIKEVKEKPAKTKAKKLSLGVEELQAIVATAVKAAQEDSTNKTADAFEKLATAMIDARKPYKDPRQEENDKAMRESMRKVREAQLRQRDNDRKYCAHLQGSNPLSEFQGQLSSFALHQSDTGEVVGICTNCGKPISSLKEEDRQFFARKSANKMSRAGQRSFANPTDVQKAGAEHRGF